MIKFSVIIPIYNVEKYLTECLESVINQSYANYEIICVNDASTDHSYDVLLRYAKECDKIKVINNSQNRGLSYSRNIGLEHAQGEYVWFVDSDDYIAENALQIIVDRLETDKVDILNFNYQEIADDSFVSEWKSKTTVKFVEMDCVETGQKWFCENMKNHTMIVTSWSKVFRKQFLYDNNLTFYEGLLHEDVLFLVQAIIPAQYVANLAQSLYMYRQRGQSITKMMTEKRMDSYVVIINELLIIWKRESLEKGMDEALRAYIIERCLPLLQKYMFYFPNHKKLEIGGAADQFLFEMLCLMGDNSRYRMVELKSDELEIIKKYKKRIIYGAGMIAREVINLLESLYIEIEAIAVSNSANNAEQLGKYKIYQIEELIKMREDVLIIVAVANKYQEAIQEKLVSLQFKNIMLIDTSSN